MALHSLASSARAPSSSFAFLRPYFPHWPPLSSGFFSSPAPPRASCPPSLGCTWSPAFSSAASHLTPMFRDFSCCLSSVSSCLRVLARRCAPYPPLAGPVSPLGLLRPPSVGSPDCLSSCWSTSRTLPSPRTCAQPTSRSPAPFLVPSLLNGRLPPSLVVVAPTPLLRLYRLPSFASLPSLPRPPFPALISPFSFPSLLGGSSSCRVSAPVPFPLLRRSSRPLLGPLPLAPALPRLYSGVSVSGVGPDVSVVPHFRPIWGPGYPRFGRSLPLCPRPALVFCVRLILTSPLIAGLGCTRWSLSLGCLLCLGALLHARLARFRSCRDFPSALPCALCGRLFFSSCSRLTPLLLPHSSWGFVKTAVLPPFCRRFYFSCSRLDSGCRLHACIRIAPALCFAPSPALPFSLLPLLGRAWRTFRAYRLALVFLLYSSRAFLRFASTCLGFRSLQQPLYPRVFGFPFPSLPLSLAVFPVCWFRFPRAPSFSLAFPRPAPFGFFCLTERWVWSMGRPQILASRLCLLRRSGLSLLVSVLLPPASGCFRALLALVCFGSFDWPALLFCAIVFAFGECCCPPFLVHCCGVLARFCSRSCFCSVCFLSLPLGFCGAALL